MGTGMAAAVAAAAESSKVNPNQQLANGHTIICSKMTIN